MVSNADVAHLMREAARRMRGPNAKYRASAYLRAADTVEAFPEDVAAWLESGRDLRALPGIGAGLAARIEEALRTGTLKVLDEPPAKRRARNEELEPDGSMLLAQATAAADTIAGWLRQQPDVRKATPAGDVRLGIETVRDFVFVASCAEPASLMAAWHDAPFARQVAMAARRGGTITLVSGHKATLFAVKASDYWSALVAATGSDGHVNEIVRQARGHDLQLDGRGLWQHGQKLAVRSEEGVYARFGLPFIDPKLRQGLDEVDAAVAGRLPTLVQASDLLGDLHMHTDATDGMASIDAMVDAAAKRGLRYVAITDHTQRTKIARGLSPTQMERHLDRIQAVARKRKDIQVLLGAEVDILRGGNLDLPSTTMARLDVAVCSLHHRGGENGKTLTDWLIKAMSHDHAAILGHPTGRLIGRRAAIDLDLPRLLEAARDGGWAVELDGQADRLDLPAPWARRAKELGVPVSLSSDAHSVGELANLDNALVQGQRAWLEAKDVLNAKPWRSR